MTRKFTGWHMLATMVCFFAVVVAVNLYMASAAIGTFGGVVVDNAYVASQRYNGWLDAARVQARQGWNAKASVVDGRAEIALHDLAGPVSGVRVDVVARHPLSRHAERRLPVREIAPGRYQATSRLPAGRWVLHIHVQRGAEDARFIRDVRL